MKRCQCEATILDGVDVFAHRCPRHATCEMVKGDADPVYICDGCSKAMLLLGFAIVVRNSKL